MCEHRSNPSLDADTSRRQLIQEIERLRSREAALSRELARLRSAEPCAKPSNQAAQDSDELDRWMNALRETQEELREAQHLAHIGSWRWDAKTDVTTGSDELLRIYGFDPENQKMPDFKDQRGRCYPVEEWERVNAAVQRTLETGIGYELDVRAIRSGEIIWVTTRSEAVRDAGGRVVGLRGTVQDITARRRAQEAQRLAAEQYAHQVRLFEGVVSTTPDHVFVFDVDGRFLYANRRLLEVWGMQLPQVIGKTCRDLGYEQWQHDRHMSEIAQVIQTKRAVKGEVPFTAPLTGTFGVYEYIFTPVIGPDGEVHAIAGISRDVTERKRMEDALRLGEMQFRVLANSMPQLVWTADSDGTVKYYNDRYKEYEGIRKMPDGTFQWKPVLHEEDVSPTAKAWEAAYRTGETYQIEHRVKKTDGSYRWHLSRGIPVRDSLGRITQWFGTATDIEDVRRAESKLREWNASLEQQVAHRTAVAENRAKQLQALSMELIEAEERQRRQFAHLLHDDLQQMLAAAKMQLQAVPDTSPHENLLKNVRQILEESIDKTRRLSHELSPAVLHHAGLVAGLEWLAGQMRSQFGLNIQLENNTDAALENKPLKLFLFRAVQELLFNIVKHAGVKSARIRVSSSDGFFAIAVSDTGRGFDPGKLLASRGTAGFGLLTIRERANYIGVILTIESTPGRGSCFTLAVPLQIAANASAPA